VIAYYLQQLIQILPFFLKGLWMTVLISGISLFLGTTLGFILGMLRSRKNRLLNPLIGFFVDIMRGTPFIVQVFIVFFILPEFGIQLEAFTAAVLAMTIMGSAFICEIVTAGILSVPKGQWEASSSGGLNILQQLRLVIMPQAMKTILPPLVGQYVLLIKDSSVVSAIGVVELTRVGWLTVVRIPEGLMVFSLVGVLYFAVSYPLIRISNRLEKKLTVNRVSL